MNVLVIGSGGREHALAWKLQQSPHVRQVYVCPGNGGIPNTGRIRRVEAMSIDELVLFALSHHIELTVVGPEDWLADGVVDAFSDAGLFIIGPNQVASQLESSKSFAKGFLHRHHIPTADYKVFAQLPELLSHVSQCPLPVVIKADGLASGKGVVVATTRFEAKHAAEHLFELHQKVVVEEFLEGVESSFIVLMDGKTALPLATSQDHKRLRDNDEGPNTGGMGAVSPSPVIDDKVHHKIIKDIIQPTLAGLIEERLNYAGFLYVGLMLDAKGNPKVLEFNCRLGDPETQPILMRLQSDLVPLLMAAGKGKLSGMNALWHPHAAVGVVLASAGYPEQPIIGVPLMGTSHPQAWGQVFYSGIRHDGYRLLTSGGRVACATALGRTQEEARTLAYELAQTVVFEGCQYRTDIAMKR